MLKNIFNGKKKIKFYIAKFVIAILSITLGTALLSSTLRLQGNTTVKKNSWIIYFDNIDNFEASEVHTGTELPSISKDGVLDPTKQNVEFTAKLYKPGDIYEFTVDTVNDGTIDAEIESLEKSVLTEEQQKYLEFEVKYDDGTDIERCDILYRKNHPEPETLPNRRTIKATVKYKSGLPV